MISVKVTDTAVQASLARLKANAGNLRPAMQDVGKELAERIRGQFSKGQSPYGDAWAPLSLRTQRARKGRRAGGQPLLDTGRLRASITSNPSASAVTVGTSSVAYAATHQFGRGKIPARPYMPIQGGAADLPAPWMAAVVGIIEDHLLEGA